MNVLVFSFSLFALCFDSGYMCIIFVVYSNYESVYELQMTSLCGVFLLFSPFIVIFVILALFFLFEHIRWLVFFFVFCFFRCSYKYRTGRHW